MIPCLEQPEKPCLDASDVYLAAGLTSAKIKLPMQSSLVLILTEISLRLSSHPKHGVKNVGLTRFPDLDPAHLQTAAPICQKVDAYEYTV